MLRKTKLIQIISAAILLASCTQQIENSNVDDIKGPVSPTASTTPDNFDSNSPLVTYTPTQSRIQSTPVFRESRVVERGFLLSSSDDPDCPLPCWQGLWVNQSSREDVQDMFESAFGFEENFDIFSYKTGVNWSSRADELEIPGYQAAGNVWQSFNWLYEVHVEIDEETGILQGIRFLYITGIDYTDSGELVTEGLVYKTHTPRQVIEVLGRPDDIYFDTRHGLEMLLIYNTGIMSYFWSEAPEMEDTRNGVSGLYRQFCLNIPGMVDREFIIPPFDLDESAAFSLIQQRWILDTIRYTGVIPLEDTDLGYTVDEIVDIALSDDPCLLLSRMPQE